MEGYKVFRSLIPDPKPSTKVSTYDHPVQSLVWDDFTVEPGHGYEYVFHPFKGTPASPDRTTAPVSIMIEDGTLSAGDARHFFQPRRNSRPVLREQVHNKPRQAADPEEEGLRRTPG